MMRSHDEPPRDGSASDLDPALRRAVDALRALPVVPADAAARVLAATRGAAHALPVSVLRRPPRRRPRWVVAVAGVAATLLVAALGVRLATSGATPGTNVIASTPSASPTLVADTDVAGAPGRLPALRTVAVGESGLLDDAPVPVPFVLRLQGASRVALVGDFNGWSPTATSLVPTGNDVWTATVPLTPGRHAYGFVVDDTLWVRDPRAELVRDPDYGRDHSVVVVGRP